MVKVELNLITKGRIPWGVRREVAGALRDCYRRFGSRVPYKVDVHIMDRESTMRDFLKDEKFKLGITTSGDEESICTHDAWRGYPRIIFCFENLARFSRLARLGAVRHEAAHSVLHGSLEYYIFRIPEDCRRTAVIKAIDSTALDRALHDLSVAVKDFEATRFLVRHDYIGCQFAFALEWLQPSDEEKLAWKTAKTDRQARFTYQTALLRPTLFAHPLLALPRSNKISLEQQVHLGRRVEELVEHLGDAEQNRLLQVTNVIVENLTEDTHANVDSALLQAMSLA